MERRTLAAVGIAFLAIVALGVVTAYGRPLAVADPEQCGGHGQAWWTQGLTEQQVAEIRDKIWEIRAQGSAEGWTEEQTRTAIHQLLAQYGIQPQGPGFVDADGDGICDRDGMGFRRGHGRYWNQTNCPWR